MSNWKNKQARTKWHKDRRLRWTNNGNCGLCGEPVKTINPRTGVKYKECYRHRVKTAKRMKLIMRRRRDKSPTNEARKWKVLLRRLIREGLGL